MEDAQLNKKQIILEPNADLYQRLAGVNNENITMIETAYDVNVQFNDQGILLSGKEDLGKAQQLIELLLESLKKYERISKMDIQYLMNLSEKNENIRFVELSDEVVVRTFSGKPIRPRTIGQQHLMDAIKHNDLSFAIGPAGTGKTFLAVCYAVDLLKKGEIKKIILTRPAVEAGENLGFLPGDLKEKVDPYLRPLYDALDTLLSSERVERYIEKGIIEIAPLAYMRGRTLDDAVVILDEAQNTTRAQMMMFLSRLGTKSKMIVNGDVDQIDLPKKEQSGLVIAAGILQDIPGLEFVKLSHSDIVRHPLVIKVLERFADQVGK